MNIMTLKAAEKAFLNKYPGGFKHPEMQAISKKHKPDKMMAKAQELFAPELFEKTDEMIEHMIKMVSASSMVSVFEKPKFRDFARALGEDEKRVLVKGLYELLHGDMETGFDMMVEVLTTGKLAKWTLITVYPAYYKPEIDVFIKPTTAKGIIKFLELEDIVYKPTPTWEFYAKYRDYINEMKKQVSPDLGSWNAAFSGFLMMCMEGLED